MSSHPLKQQRINREKKLIKSKGSIGRFLDVKDTETSPKSLKYKSPFILSPALQKSTSKDILSNNLEQIFTRSYSQVRKSSSTSILDLPKDLHQMLSLTSKLPDKYELRKWIVPEKLNYEQLSRNPNCVTFLNELFKKDIFEYSVLPVSNKIDWSSLSANPNAMYLLSKRIEIEKKIMPHFLKFATFDKINWMLLSSNPNAIIFLAKRIEEESKLTEAVLGKKHITDKICWKLLSSNPNAVHLLKANPHKINWYYFVQNTNLDIELFKELLSKIKDNKKITSLEKLDFNSIWNIPNSKLIDFLYKEIPEKINWKELSYNSCTSAIKLLTANQSNIDWHSLSTNYSATKLLLDNPEKIIIIQLCLNTNHKAIKYLKDKFIEEPTIMTDRDTKDFIWSRLSANPKAVKILERYPEYIHLNKLCSNPNAVRLIKKNIEKIYEYPYDIKMYNLSSNPCIFYEL